MEQEIVFVMVEFILKNESRESRFCDHTRFGLMNEFVNEYRRRKSDIGVVRFAFIGDKMEIEKVVFEEEDIPQFFLLFDRILCSSRNSLN
jgi:hypothetical protein